MLAAKLIKLRYSSNPPGLVIIDSNKCHLLNCTPSRGWKSSRTTPNCLSNFGVYHFKPTFPLWFHSHPIPHHESLIRGLEDFPSLYALHFIDIYWSSANWKAIGFSSTIISAFIISCLTALTFFLIATLCFYILNYYYCCHCHSHIDVSRLFNHSFFSTICILLQSSSSHYNWNMFSQMQNTTLFSARVTIHMTCTHPSFASMVFFSAWHRLGSLLRVSEL